MPSFFFHVTIDRWDNSNRPVSNVFHVCKRATASRRVDNLFDREATEDPKALDNNLAESRRLGSPQQLSPKDPVRYKHTDDRRCGAISLQSIDMLPNTIGEKHPKENKPNDQITNGISGGPGGLATKGRYEPTDVHNEDLGWGVVRLYRDSEETPGLYDEVTTSKHSKHGRGTSKASSSGQDLSFRDEDCTTLCILAVPAYMTPSDFLGFVGEKTREGVSHFRMIRTERVNRYMVLMKFRNGKRAREWRKEWNGKVFNSMEPENCHVVFVKSIEFRELESDARGTSFPDMSNDPFTPSKAKSEAVITKGQSSAVPSTSLSTKPVAPPTPALVELPTCPVCLERMDESTGLLTILCQHVFHCSCLQKWRGSGCPVCRYTQDDLGKRLHSFDEEPGLNECTICRSDVNLWICLICGNVGCGRYDAAHAFLHYQHTSHCFAMDLTTQRVWDYASDGYVHRIVQNKTDGKVVELPSANHTALPLDDITEDYLPREKLESIGLEYTHLLTSQLDSQRLYFEEKVERAADKASEATLASTSAVEAAERALTQLKTLQLAQGNLVKDIIPTLERDRDRAVRKAEKFEGMARNLEKEWREEKALAGSLLDRVKLLDEEVGTLKAENLELKEQNRDLGFFISGGEKLRETGLGEEAVEGTVSLPAEGKGKSGKGKGRGRGRGS